jgi:hypothetical protein
VFQQHKLDICGDFQAGKKEATGEVMIAAEMAGDMCPTAAWEGSAERSLES